MDVSVAVGLNLAASTLSSSITQEIFHTYKKSFEKSIKSSAVYKRAEISIRQKFETLLKALGPEDATKVINNCMEKIRISKEVADKFETHAIKYAKLAADELSKMGEHKYWGSKFTMWATVGKVVGDALLAGSAIAVITQMTKNTEEIITKLEANLESECKRVEGKADSAIVTNTQATKDFCDQKMKQTLDTILNEINSYVHNAMLQPAAALGLGFATKGVTESLKFKAFKTYQKTAEIKSALVHVSHGDWELDPSLRDEALQELDKLAPGDVYKPDDSNNNDVISIDGVKMTVGEAKGSHKGLLLMQIEPGVVVGLREDFKQNLDYMKESASGTFALRAMATNDNVRVVVIDGKTMKVHQMAPDGGLLPFDGKVEDLKEAVLILRDGHLTPATRSADGKFIEVNLAPDQFHDKSYDVS
jgi:hypothetical protein